MPELTQNKGPESEREIDREREREMSLTKTKVHTTGSPISTATTLTEILTASQIRRPSFRHPIFTNMEKKPTKGRTTQTEINTIHRPLQKSRLKLWWKVMMEYQIGDVRHNQLRESQIGWGLNAHLWYFFSYEVEDPIRLVLYKKENTFWLRSELKYSVLCT